MLQISYWEVVIAVIILLLSHWAAYSCGYWRGGSLRVRVIGMIALAAIGVPAILVSVEQWLKLDLGGLDWIGALVAIIAIVCLTVIEVMHIKVGDDTKEPEASGMKAKDLLISILTEWIDELSEEDVLHGNLKREILWVIARRDYPNGQLHLSPNINWPQDYNPYQRLKLIRSAWHSFKAHGTFRVELLENEFSQVIAELKRILDDNHE
jgi:hypothetical protein